jgi:hypothetical protein
LRPGGEDVKSNRRRRKMVMNAWMSRIEKFTEEFDLFIYRLSERFFDRLPKRNRRLWIFLLMTALMFAITLVDVWSDFKTNLRPILIFPVLVCSVFTNRLYAYAIALTGGLLWSQAFRIKIIPDDGGFLSLVNSLIVFIALLGVAELTSLSVNTIRDMAAYIVAIEDELEECREKLKE